jgi:hypothetical protein
MPSLGSRERRPQLFMPDKDLSGCLSLGVFLFNFILFTSFLRGLNIMLIGCYRWRKPVNVWRQAPFFVTALPTIIKVTADGVNPHRESRNS